jgi:hypothetical protein
MTMVESGGRLPRRCCSPLLNRETSALGTDETNRRDLLLLLPVDAAQKVDNLNVRVVGDNGLTVNEDGAQALEMHDASWVARIPVTLDPAKPWDIGGNRYPLTVTATYSVPEDGHARTFNARGAVEAQVPNAIYEMGTVSAILPLLCLGASIRRWRQTR